MRIDEIFFALFTQKSRRSEDGITLYGLEMSDAVNFKRKRRRRARGLVGARCRRCRAEPEGPSELPLERAVPKVRERLRPRGGANLTEATVGGVVDEARAKLGLWKMAHRDERAVEIQVPVGAGARDCSDAQRQHLLRVTCLHGYDDAASPQRRARRSADFELRVRGGCRKIRSIRATTAAARSSSA